MPINLKDRVRNGELDLSSSGLKEIPLKEITSLKNIHSINLSNNKLQSVTKGFFVFPQLTKLDLSRNQIKGLPESIGSLTNLKHLNLSQNSLATLPVALGSLKNLKYLNVKANPLSQKYAELTGPCENESQCQQAARNVLKALATSDNDKKKKLNQADSDSKKKKEKVQNGAVNKQKSQKGQKSKKSNRGFVEKVFSFVSLIFRSFLYVILIAGLSIYGLSFYDKVRYESVKTSYLIPVYQSATKQVLSEDTAAQLTDVLTNVGGRVNAVVVASAKFGYEKATVAYMYVSTEPTIAQYVNRTKNYAQETWKKFVGPGS